MINNDIEYKSVEEIKAYQENLLHEALAYLQAHSPYYQRMFKSYGIQIDKIRHIEDLVKIPFTEKKDLQLFFIMDLTIQKKTNIVLLMEN